MRKRSNALALAVLIVISSGCYHHHLRANGERVNSSPFRKTLDSSSKRILPPADQGSSGLPSSADCQDNGLYEVGITSSWKYAAGTVFSFGRWSRVKVEWFCAKEPPVIGLIGQPPAEQPTAGISQKTGQGNFTKRTVHAFFWGGLQQNLLPPAPSGASKTPANCKSMRQVKVPMNYGYAFITVATLGIWSPMQVAWQCKE
ncbi:MAG: hypothetical protein WBV94_25610 [Blastocatellia bacterium]